MKQKFKLEIELPDDWLLNPETLKKMIERETIFKVLQVEENKCSVK